MKRMCTRHLVAVTGLCFLASCVGQVEPGSEQTPEAEGSIPEGAVEVTLVAKVPQRGSDEWMRWSPYGKQLPLTEVEDGMRAELELGLPGTPSIEIRLKRSAESDQFDQLLLDLDRDGSFDPDEVLSTTPTEQNYKFWSSFDAIVQIPVVDPASGEEAQNAYPLGLWYVEDPRVPDEEPVIRFSRHGYMLGSVTLGETESVVLVTENVLDGVFGPEDSWALASQDSAKNVLHPAYSSSMEEHNWLLDQAYRVVEVDPSGRRLLLAPFDPGITRAEEEEMNDHLKVDREAARSGRTVAFGHDYEEALASARQDGKALFIDFETTWCGPCKIMDEWVYTADVVVDASSGLIAVKVDGDERLDQKEHFGVSGFPTMILLDSEGEEIRRASGYVNVEDMATFLGG